MNTRFMVLVGLLSLSGCAVGWRIPSNQERTQLLMPMLSSSKVDPDLYRAAQFQVAACENVANAYTAKANTRNVVNIVFGAIGGSAAVAGAGAVISGVAGDGGPTSGNTRAGLTVAGAILTGVGASIASIVGIVAGSDGTAGTVAETATKVRDAVAEFRKELRELVLGDAFGVEAKQDAVNNALASQVCALRATCNASVPPAGNVGYAFDTDSKGDVLVLSDAESKTTEEKNFRIDPQLTYLERLCEHDNLPIK